MGYIYDTNISYIRRRIKGLREKHKLSQAEIANYLGISQRAYSYYENSRDIPLYLLIKFANFYEVSIESMIRKNNDKIKS